MNRIKKFTSPVTFAIILLIISIVIVIFASQVLYQHTVNLLTNNLRERLLTISITVASNVDAKDLEELKVEEDWHKPAWIHVVTQLNRAKYSNKDIVFMYIFRKKADDPTQIEFVVDADSIDPYANISNDETR